MKHIYKVILSLILFCFSSFFVTSQNVDEIISKHFDAHGGLKNWELVKSMKITGRFTGFSNENDFTMIKVRPNLYYGEYYLGKHKVVEGYSGKIGWTINPWYDFTFPRRINTAEEIVMLQRAEFCTPFFNYNERGFKVEFLGKEKLDGIDVLKLKLTRDNKEVETWYLDSKTYLEFMSVSTWEDFGRPAIQETYYSDFRTVENLKIPFYIERSFSTRHRVFEIEKVEVNIKTDNSVFKMPLSEEMKKMQVLEGDWDVIVEAMGRAGSWVTADTTTSCIKFMKNTNLLQEEMSYERFFPTMIKINWTYNITSKKYVMTAFNSLYSTTSVFEGTVTNDTILFDNTEISFSTTDKEKKRSGRYLVTGISEDGFVIEVSVSTDKGEKWTSREKFTYTRRKR